MLTTRPNSKPMIQVHSNFLEELSDYLSEHEDDADAKMLLGQLNMYIDNQAVVNNYQADTMAFIAKELGG